MIVGLADLGPWPTKKKRAETIETTIWARRRPGRPRRHLRADQARGHRDRPAGQRRAGEPRGSSTAPSTRSRRPRPRSSSSGWTRTRSRSPPSREDWQVGGILCYSKICTHVGCPISLWEQQTHHLLCPCHQSTFDLGDSGVVVFGPARGRCRSCRSPWTLRATWSPERLHRPDRPELLRAGLAQRFQEGDN